MNKEINVTHFQNPLEGWNLHYCIAFHDLKLRDYDVPSV